MGYENKKITHVMDLLWSSMDGNFCSQFAGNAKKSLGGYFIIPAAGDVLFDMC